MPLLATPNGIVLLTATCRVTIQRERIVAFPCQQWLRDSATVLRYKYTAYLVCKQLRSEVTTSDVTYFLFHILTGMRVLESVHCIHFPKTHF